MSIYFPDAYTGYVVGFSGTILKTINGGITWTTLSSGTTSELLSVFFTNDNMGCTVGNDGTILTTTNGGGWGIGIDENYHPVNVIFPNPFSDHIMIKNETNKSVQIYLYNLNGRLISTQKTRYNTRIELNNLSKGIYILKICDNESVYSQKIVIQ